MVRNRWIVLTIAVASAVALVGCTTPAGGPPDAAPTGGETAGGAAGGGETGGLQATAVVTEGVPMVASGAATLPPRTPLPEGERPQPEQGIQRSVSLEEARAGVPFTLLEPQTLPETADLTMVHLVQPIEGALVATLPAARMIYDIEGDLLVIYQSPATGEPAPGDPVTVGGETGWIKTAEQVTLLTWERDGVRIELRTTALDRDALLELAEGLAPAASTTGEG